MKKQVLYIYTRVSTDKQVDKGYSLLAQEKIGIQKAKQYKMDYKVFREEGKSAAKEDLINRPVLTELIDLMRIGEVKHLFAIEWSRISRNEITTAYIKKELLDNNVIVYTAEGKYDLSDFNSDFIASIILLNAKRENRERVERSKRGRLESALQGKWSGGTLAYGYTTDKENNLVIDEKEKINYLKMVKYSLSGMGAGSIAKKLNELNIPTKGTTSYKKGITLKDKYTGKITFKKREHFIWKQGTIERILKNTLYKGERHYKDETIVCPSCIDSVTWQKIQDNFVKNRNFAGRNNIKNFYLLKGLLFCNRCGKTIIGRISEKKGTRVYFCMSKRSEEIDFCGMKSINIDAINKMVWEKFLYVLTNSSVVRKELKKKFANTKENIIDINREISSLNNSLKVKEDEKSQLIRLITKKMITDTDFNKHSIEIETTKDELRKRIKMNENKILISQKEESNFAWILQIEEKAKELFYLKDETKKQEILRTFITRITIDWLEKENEHVIQIELKYPLFTNGKFKEDFLLDGTSLDEQPDITKISIREKYEIDAEETEYNENEENDGKLVKKKVTNKLHYDSPASETVW